MSTEEVFVVVPTEQQLLSRETNVRCTEIGCNKQFIHKGALKMHLIKSHRQVNTQSDLRLLHKGVKGDVTKFHFHCPERYCRYSEGSQRFFSTFSLVKQHFIKVHAEKKFVCTKCDMGFGLKHDLERHLKSCGIMYTCGSCPVEYSTKEALLMHCKRSEHIYPDEYQRQTKAEKEKKQKKNQAVVTSIVQPVILIAVQTPLPGQPAQLPPIKPKQSIQAKPSDIRKEKKDNVVDSVIDMPDEESAKHDALIQTDIYGVNTLALSDRSMSSNIAGKPVHVEKGLSAVVANTDKVGNEFRNIKSPPKRQMSQKRRMSQGYINPCSPRRKKLKSTTGMQTSVSLTRKKGVPAVGSTQTTGDYILQTAMKQADIQIEKKTVGSQVTPQKNKVGGENSFKSSEIQTFISGFKPQLVDSSSQVYNFAESETMTDLPLSTSTQTLQSFLESQQEKNTDKTVEVDVNDRNEIAENKATKEPDSRHVVKIYGESLDTSISFVMPEAKNCSSNRTNSDMQTGNETESGVSNNEVLTAVKISDHASNESTECNKQDTSQNMNAASLADDKLFEENYLASHNQTSDMEAQAMSASEFDQLLQSSGIFLGEDNIFQNTSSQVSPRQDIKDSINQTLPSNLDFLSIGTSTSDMNTQTGPDLSIFDDFVPIDSNTQTVGDVDFLDLVMSHTETQTLNDEDLISLGLLDGHLHSANVHNMSVGTGDLDIDNSNFINMKTPSSEFKTAPGGPPNSVTLNASFFLNETTIQTGSNNIASDGHRLNQMNQSVTNASFSTDTDQKQTVQMETQTVTTDTGENMLHIENQTQVDLADTGFETINMETQTTFDDLQEFCEMLQ